jgi:hypothetical protein
MTNTMMVSATSIEESFTLTLPTGTTTAGGGQPDEDIVMTVLGECLAGKKAGATETKLDVQKDTTREIARVNRQSEKMEHAHLGVSLLYDRHPDDSADGVSYPIRRWTAW